MLERGKNERGVIEMVDTAEDASGLTPAKNDNDAHASF